MSGDNFVTQLEVESTSSGITVSNVQVADRGNLTFDISASGDEAKGGHPLTYRTREGFDGSEVEIENNVVILPKQPSVSGVSAPQVSGFAEVGADEAESGHPDGHDISVSGAEFYNLQQVEDALQSGATLAGLGLTAPAGSELRCRVGKLDQSGADDVWTDDQHCTITINSVSETSVNVTLSIDPQFDIAQYDDDTRTLDLVIETYSGDLGDAGLEAEKYARAGDNIDYSGRYAIATNAITVRRARPEAIAEVYMLDNATLPTAGDAASIVAAKTAGKLTTAGDFSFKQSETKKFLFVCESAFAGNLDCLDSSANLKNLASTTSPAGGFIHAAGTGQAAPGSGFSVGAGGNNELTILSEREFMVTMAARADQEIGEYVFKLATQSSNGDYEAAVIAFDLSAGVFAVTTLDLALVSPEVLMAQSGSITATVSGEGLPEGFGVVGHENETGTKEGSVSIAATPSSPGQAGFAAQIANVAVQSDSQMTFDIAVDPTDMATHIATGGSADDCLGNFNVLMTVADAAGGTQNQTESIRVIHAWPPEQGGNHGNALGQNFLREASQENLSWADDDISLRLLRLRGDHQPGGAPAYPAVNGIAPALEYGEVEIKLCLKDSNGNYQDMSDSWKLGAEPVAADLIQETDALGTDKPLLLITGVEASKTGMQYADSDGVTQDEYLWDITVRCTTEEAMMRSMLADQYPSDLDPENNQFAVAIRKDDASEDASAGVSEWYYVDDVFSILPANIEVSADAHELARDDSESVAMAGGNFYPAGAGTPVNPATGGYSWTVIDSDTVSLDVSSLTGAEQAALEASINSAISPSFEDVGQGANGGTVDLFDAVASLPGDGTLQISKSNVGHPSMGLPSKVTFNSWADGGPVEILGL